MGVSQTQSRPSDYPHPEIHLTNQWITQYHTHVAVTSPELNLWGNEALGRHVNTSQNSSWKESDIQRSGFQKAGKCVTNLSSINEFLAGWAVGREAQIKAWCITGTVCLPPFLLPVCLALSSFSLPCPLPGYFGVRAASRGVNLGNWKPKSTSPSSCAYLVFCSSKWNLIYTYPLMRLTEPVQVKKTDLYL